jgi:hypothetical protein
MKLVVVGGQARKVGKTSVIAGVIQGLKELRWTAVKISRHSSTEPEKAPAHDLPAHLNYALSEESEPTAPRDTSRFLAAGARRALWLRAGEGGLAQAVPLLLEVLAGNEHVIMESNSIMEFVEPALYLLVVGEGEQELKATARRFLGRADALVRVVSPGMPDDGTPPEGPPPELAAQPVFTVSAGEWWSAALGRFIAERVL